MHVRACTVATTTLLSLTLMACGDDLGGLDEGDGIELDGETGDEVGDTDDSGDAGLDDTTGDTGDDDGDGFCSSESFQLSQVTPNVMLVLDKSGSMNANEWDDDGDSSTPKVTRWHSLHGVVADVTGKYDGDIDFGVTLFPAADAEYDSGDFDSSCGVADSPDVGVGPSHSAAILAAIPSADDEDFGGATPATEGVLTGAAHLEALETGMPRAMVLITDGAANCAETDDFVGQYDEALPEAVADAWSGAGIPTFVVGIDISEDGGHVDVNPREALHDVALAGGVAREGEVGFYDATDPAALDAALEEIATRLECQVELEFDPDEFAGMVIDADGQTFGQVDSCEDGDGWVQIDPLNQPNKIELCNAACEAAALSGLGEAKLFCPIIP